MSSEISLSPRVIAGDEGGIFVLDYTPIGRCQGAVLFVPPFAEELNRSRRMIALQSRILAAKGYRVVVADLFGTGDSGGEFGDARWHIWINDLGCVYREFLENCDFPVWIWGLRHGALLAFDAIQKKTISGSRILLWNPVTDGKTAMTQFLRMRLMAQLVAGSETRESTSDIRAMFAAGKSVEVAGYLLSSALVADIEALKLSEFVAKTEIPIVWLDVVASEGQSLPASTRRFIDEVENADSVISASAVYGPAFWSSAEIAVAPKLLEVTGNLFGSGC